MCEAESVVLESRHSDDDDRVAAATAELRANRREERAKRYMPSIEREMEACRCRGDYTYKSAFAVWITGLRNRTNEFSGHPFDASKDRHARIPHLLRRAVGLESQEVLLERNGRLRALVGNRAGLVLFDPYASYT